MRRFISAGLIYFLLVFSIGFLLGTIRVLIAAPRFGELVSALIELPIILTAAWIICHWLVKQYLIPPRWPSRLAMGAIAFVLLMLAELGLAVLLVGNSVAEHFTSYRELPKSLGLAGQVAFALFPLIQLRKNYDNIRKAE